MLRCAVFGLIFIVFACKTAGQELMLEIQPVDSSFTQYEEVYLKIRIQNYTTDTVCIGNLAFDYSSTPMQMTINGHYQQYTGLFTEALSGVYVSPNSSLCWYMRVYYHRGDRYGLMENSCGQYLLICKSKVWRVENRRVTRDSVGTVEAVVKYQVVFSPVSYRIANEIKEWQDSVETEVKRPAGERRFMKLYNLVEEYGIESVNMVAHSLIVMGKYYNCEWGKKLFERATDELIWRDQIRPNDCDHWHR